jgi:hypothetical protein
MRAKKRYNTSYKKTHIEQDMYLPRREPKGIQQCSGCGAFHYRRHWSMLPPSALIPEKAERVLCPACRKIKDSYPAGELTLTGLAPGDRPEIARILRNEEVRAREKNPLERIMSMKTATGGWRVATTTEKLAQRLGRAVRKARGGKLEYKWSHNNKFVRVIWHKKDRSAASDL